ncbi:o-succinylbenzoate synthase [Salmonirosea aquatica]|uniref:O-succinylbenzoate synthase n=1 Tax=Salmonirosea aquatica TaxID=2654236 RepID=A0A7C9BGE2_9BACT|nr:o-succinylbenzoate synthase [Cytophagaceae bacterium SJW1-29]
MPLLIQYQPYLLQFNFAAGTSRGVLTAKTSWFVRVSDQEQPGVIGYGECGPLAGLSTDDLPDFETKLTEICQLFNSLELDVFPFNLPIILEQVIPQQFPSIRFGIEMALLDFMQGGNRTPFPNAFARHKQGIPINGLVWMGTEEFMQSQIDDKIARSFTTIKLKVGALDFDRECRILENLRSRFSPEEITLRVDANGAFGADDAMEKLNRLAEFSLHSIEQPIAPGQPERMAELVATSPIPIALDEELIGKMDYMEKFSLLKSIHPPFIILKPTLLGGFQQCREWIEIAQRLSIGWWITSALESNVGLNAIAQFTAQFDPTLPQGLGTGQIYQNNFPSPLYMEHGCLHADPNTGWDLSPLENLWRTV